MLKKMKQEDYHSAPSEEITVTAWKETKDVSFLTNVHSSRGDDHTSRKKQDGTVHSITAPYVVKDYNNMGAGGLSLCTFQGDHSHCLEGH